MKKQLHLLFLLFLFGGYVLPAQTTDSIYVKGSTFKQNEKTLNHKQLFDAMKKVPETKQWTKKAENYRAASMIFSFTGGAFIGWPIGTWLGGGEPNWILAGIGAGLVMGGFVFESQYVINTTKAVGIYNENLPSAKKKIDIQVGMLGTGLGVRVKF